MDNYENLIKEINSCKKCDLYKTKTNYVVGEGPLNAKIMIIGEAPGFWEDKNGVPFCGKAGKVLDLLLTHVNIKRDEVYITNIVKCRPPNNRAPTNEEKKQCSPYLDKQIEIIKPKIIITLGNHSTKYILKKYGYNEQNISKIKGKVFESNTLFGKIKIIPLYHPAVGVYNPNLIDTLKKDFEIVKQVLLS